MKPFSTAGFVCIVLWVQAIHAQLPPAYEQFYGDPLGDFSPSINYNETGSGSVQISFGDLCPNQQPQCFELTPSGASEVAVTFSLPTEQFFGNYNDLQVAVSVAETLSSAGYYCAVEVNVDNQGFGRLFQQEGFGELLEHAMTTNSDVIFPGSTIAVRLIAGTYVQSAEPFSCFFDNLALAGSSGIATTPPSVDGGEIIRKSLSQIGYYELVHFNLDALQASNHIFFTAFNQTFDLELEVNEHLHPATIKYSSDYASKYGLDQFPAEYTASCHYYVKMRKPDGSVSATGSVSLCDKRGIRGQIKFAHDIVFIRPSRYYLDRHHDRFNYHDIHDEHLVYRYSDYDYTADDTYDGNENTGGTGTSFEFRPNVGNRKPQQPQQQRRRRLVDYDGNNVVRIYAAIDPLFVAHFKREYPNNWESTIRSTMNDLYNAVSDEFLYPWFCSCNAVTGCRRGWEAGGRADERECEYEGQWADDVAGIAVNLVQVDMCESWDDCPGLKYDMKGKSPHSESALEKMGAYQAKYRGITWDQATFFVGAKMACGANGGSCGGMAHLGAICRGPAKATATIASKDQTSGTEWDFERWKRTTAHELGHTFGMEHDGQGYNDCHKDAGQLGYGQATERWSRCSQDYLVDGFRNGYRGCIDETKQISCVEVEGFTENRNINGRWVKYMSHGGYPAYALGSAYWLYFNGWKWMIAAKGSTRWGDVEAWCKAGNLLSCSGKWEKYNDRNKEVSTHATVESCDQGNAPNPTPRPTTPSPVTQSGGGGGDWDCASLSGFATSSLNGRWEENGDVQLGRSVYENGNGYYLYACYSNSYWCISETVGSGVDEYCRSSDDPDGCSSASSGWGDASECSGQVAPAPAPVTGSGGNDWDCAFLSGFSTSSFNGQWEDNDELHLGRTVYANGNGDYLFACYSNAYWCIADSVGGAFDAYCGSSGNPDACTSSSRWGAASECSGQVAPAPAPVKTSGGNDWDCAYLSGFTTSSLNGRWEENGDFQLGRSVYENGNGYYLYACFSNAYWCISQTVGSGYDAYCRSSSNPDDCTSSSSKWGQATECAGGSDVSSGGGVLDSCVYMNSMDEKPEFNGPWIQFGTSNDPQFKLNDDWWLYWTGSEWWMTAMNVETYWWARCQDESLADCGENSWSVWVYDSGAWVVQVSETTYVSECAASFSIAEDCHDVLITEMSENTALEGFYAPILNGEINGAASYQKDYEYYLYLNSAGDWVIDTGDERALAVCTSIIDVPEDVLNCETWQVLMRWGDLWSLEDSGAVITSCSAGAFVWSGTVDESLDCLHGIDHSCLSLYNEQQVLVNTSYTTGYDTSYNASYNTSSYSSRLWNGSVDFEISMQLCSNNQPIYSYLAESGNVNATERWYLQYDSSEGWTIQVTSKSILGTAYTHAICQQESIQDCVAGAWLVRTYDGDSVAFEADSVLAVSYNLDSCYIDAAAGEDVDGGKMSVVEILAVIICVFVVLVLIAGGFFCMLKGFGHKSDDQQMEVVDDEEDEEDEEVTVIGYEIEMNAGTDK